MIAGFGFIRNFFITTWAINYGHLTSHETVTIKINFT
jgi:hypothetical protein